MGKYNLLVMLLSLCSTFCYSRCEVFNIVTSPVASSCSDTPCYTLEQFATGDPSQSDNITLELQPGNHHLNSSLTLGGDISSFSITANTTASVSCGPSACFRFSDLQQVIASGIAFIDCNMELINIINASFVMCSFMDVAGYRCCAVLEFMAMGPKISVQIEECTFLKNSTTSNNSQAIVLRNGVMSILNSNLSGFVTAHPQARSRNGGVLFALSAEVTIINCSFSGNRVAIDGFGGGAIGVRNGTLTIIDSDFSNNKAELNGPGGALHIHEGRLHISTSNFWDNSAVSLGGTIYVRAGRDVSIGNTSISSSRATNNGGAAYISGGEVKITNSQFKNNSAGNLGGAALYVNDGQLAIINSSFSDNNANAGGRCGAVCTDSGRGLCIFSSNFSDNNVANSGRFSSGGALYINDSESVNITSCYFRDNAAVLGNYDGGAIYVYLGKVIISSSYFIDNNVAPGSNHSGNSIYVRKGDISVVNNSFCNKKPGSNYTIYIASSSDNVYNISISDNHFIIKDTASGGYHQSIDDILGYHDISYITIGNNNFSDITLASNCEFPASSATTQGTVTTTTRFENVTTAERQSTTTNVTMQISTTVTTIIPTGLPMYTTPVSGAVIAAAVIGSICMLCIVLTVVCPVVFLCCSCRPQERNDWHIYMI